MHCSLSKSHFPLINLNIPLPEQKSGQLAEQSGFPKPNLHLQVNVS